MIDFAYRENRARDAFRYSLRCNAKNQIRECKPIPGFPINTHQFFQGAEEVKEENEYTKSTPLLHWYAMDLPELKEEKRLHAFLKKENPILEEAKLYVGNDSVLPQNKNRQAIDPGTFLTKNQLRIPVMFATENINKMVTFLEDIETDLKLISTMSEEKLVNTINFLEERLISPTKKSMNGKLQPNQQQQQTVQGEGAGGALWKLMVHILQLFGLSEKEGIDFKHLRQCYETIRYFIGQAKVRAQKLKKEALTNRCIRLNENYLTAYKILAFYRRFYQENKLQSIEEFQNVIAQDDALIPTISEANLDSFVKKDEVKKMHCLILYYLDLAYSRGMRKAGANVYQPKKQSNGQPTYEYELFGDMKDFINLGMGDPEKSGNSTIWQWVIEGNMCRQLEQHLIFLQTSRFPSLNKNRNCFAFEEGVYNTEYDRFIYWDEINDLPFREYGIAVAKYHENVYFENEIYELLLSKTDRDWYALPTPYLFKLFDAQGYPEDVKRFLCMCGGRMLQKLGRDNWQFILWCIGKAGTGKTTFATFFSYLFAKEDVGTLSQIIEKQFGMSHFFDPKPKLLVIAPDLTKGLGLPLPIFLNWISAEKICIPRKNNTAIERDLDIPFIACSNVMALDDIKDALARRTIFLKFDKTIKKSNTRLLDYIVKYELPIILKKFTLAYWDYFKKHAHKGDDVWEFAPSYFKQTKEEMAAESNSIRYFLRKSNVVTLLTYKNGDIHNVKNYDQLIHTPVHIIGDQYNAWKKQNLSKKELDNSLTWCEDNWRPVFEQMGCDIWKGTCYYPPDSRLQANLCENVWLVSNIVITETAKRFKRTIFENKTKRLNQQIDDGNKSSSSEEKMNDDNRLSQNGLSWDKEDNQPTGRRGTKRKTTSSVSNFQ